MISLNVRLDKPDWPHFHTAIEELAAQGIPKERILHVGQSLRADVIPANKLGLTSAWIHRPLRELGWTGEGAVEAKPDLTGASFADLVLALDKSSAGPAPRQEPEVAP